MDKNSKLEKSPTPKFPELFKISFVGHAACLVLSIASTQHCNSSLCRETMTTAVCSLVQIAQETMLLL